MLTIRNGKNQKAVESTKGDYPICGSGGEMGRASDFITRGDSVIIGRKGNINNPILMREPFWNVDTAFGLEPNEEQLAVEYLYYFCEWFNFEKLNKAVTIPSLTKADLLEIAMPLPPLSAQKKFTSRIGLLDDLKSLLTDLERRLDDLVKSQFVEMFGEVADVCRLQDIAETYNGDRGKNYPTADDKVSTGYPFINAGNLRGGKVSFEEMDFITAEKYQSLSGGKICKGDILYCLRGSLGKSALSDFDEGTVASSLMIIRANPNKVIPRYLFEALNAPDVERQMRAADNGSSQPNLSAKSVRSYSIPLPPLSQQQTFADFVAKVDKLGFKQSLCYRATVSTSMQGVMQYYPQAIP